MTIDSVIVTVGYRFKFTEKQWYEFWNKVFKGHMTKLKNHDDEEDSEEENVLIESDKGDSDDSDEGDSEESYDINSLSDEDVTIDEYFDELGLKHSRISCFHEGTHNGMERIIDVGFIAGTSNIFTVDYSDQDKVSLKSIQNATNEALKENFTEKIKKEGIWTYCVNKDGPEIFFMANDCRYCS